jgi:hypothetical protein
MQKGVKKICRSVLIVLLISMIAGLAYASGQTAIQGDVLITGTVTAKNQLVTREGEAYNLGDSTQAQELKKNAGAMVEVKGTIMETDAGKTIEVTAFEIINK